MGGKTVKANRDPRPLLTLDQAGEILGLGARHKNIRHAVRRMIRRHELVGIKVLGRTMVTPESVDLVRYGE